MNRNAPFCLSGASERAGHDRDRQAHGGQFPSSLPAGVGAMTPSISGWAASVRRLERQFLANPLAAGPEGPTEIVAAVLGAHDQVPSAVELSVGTRAEATTRTGVRAAGRSGALCFGPNRGRRVTYTRPPPTALGPSYDRHPRTARPPDGPPNL